MSKPTTGDFTKTPGWMDWYSGPVQPQFILPAGAVDAHCHVFGPGSEFPYAPERKYTPCDASKHQLYALRDHLGFERNVIQVTSDRQLSVPIGTDKTLHQRGGAAPFAERGRGDFGKGNAGKARRPKWFEKA